MKILLPLCLVALLASCRSSGQPAEHEFPFRSNHTFEFVWEQCLAAAGDAALSVESADPGTRTIVTRWKEELAPLANAGQRHRITLTVKGGLEEGFILHAKEEVETNTNIEAPMDPSAADWEPSDTDGSRAEQLLFRIHRRLNPPEPWRRLSER